MAQAAGNRALGLWVQALDTQAPSTKTIYLRWMGYFLKRFEIPDAEALYRLKREDLRSDDPRDTMRVEQMVKTLMAEKMREGLKANSVKQLPKALKSFFDSQNVPFVIRPRDLPRGDTLGRKMILKEQIAKCSARGAAENQKRNRVILMSAKDAGIRISDISLLNVGHYRRAVLIRDAEGDPFRVFDPLETQKCAVNAHIHLGPEAVLAVDAYLGSRPGVGDDEPLIVERGGERITMNALSMQFSRLCAHVPGAVRLGAHSFRKFHTTQLESAGVPINWIKKLQGKSLDPSTGVYSKPEESGDLTTAYIAAYPKLRVFGADDVRQLRRELEAVRETRGLQDEKMEEMRREIEAIKERLGAQKRD